MNNKEVEPNDPGHWRLQLAAVVLRVGACLCFAGWWWVHYYWEAPYGVLLWHDGTYQLAEQWGISWDEFVGSGANDGLIQVWMARVGWGFLVCALMSLFVSGKWLWQSLVFLVGSMLLGVISYAKYVESGYELPMLIEYGGQVLMPIILLVALRFGVEHWATLTVALVALVATFLGHGLYALGVWPTPANFTGMTVVILEVEYSAAIKFLYVVGILDMVICVGVFMPFRRYVLIYAACWGFLTSLARPAAGMSTDLINWGADQFLHEAVYRAPHFMIPIYLFLIFSWRRKKAAESLKVKSDST